MDNVVKIGLWSEVDVYCSCGRLGWKYYVVYNQLSIACSHVETALPCYIPGIPLTILDDSPVAAVDYTVMEAVSHPTVEASMTPTAMRHQAAGMSLCSF